MEQWREDSARFHEWCKRITGYADMTRNQKKEKKRLWNEMNLTIPSVNTTADFLTTTSMIVIDDIVPQDAVKLGNIPVAKNQDKKGKAMFDEFNKEQQAFEHLDSRLDNLSDRKYRDMLKHFGLSDDDPPETIRDLLDRIANKQFTVAEENMDRNSWSPSGFLTWRDPAKKVDHAGFNAALKVMKDAKTKTRDEITILPAEKGLAALRAFEAQTFH